MSQCNSCGGDCKKSGCNRAPIGFAIGIDLKTIKRNAEYAIASKRKLGGDARLFFHAPTPEEVLAMIELIELIESM